MHRGMRWLRGVPLLLIALALLLQLRIERGGRPAGSSEEIRHLAQRGDVNVLFLLIDTLRADRLGAYGYARPTSPTLDALAATGVRFANHLAQSSYTKTSMASLWTGLSPARTGVLRYDHAVPADARMPAEILSDAGFHTGGIWRNGWVASNFGFAQGFQLYHKPNPGRSPAAYRRDNPASQITGTDVDVTLSAAEFLRVHGKERWFLYLHYMDVHQYLSDEESALFGTSYSDIYDNSIHWLDRQIAVLLAHLEEADLLRRTLIVVAADHGEEFGEHGREGHAKSLYSEVTATPLLISFPFALEPGIVVESPSQNVDIWPTVLELLGLPALEGADGRSLVPAILDPESTRAADPALTRISHLDRTWGRVDSEAKPMVALTELPFRYIHYADGSKADELYDLAQDAAERRNLAKSQPETAERMKAAALEYLASTPPWESAPSVEIDDLLLGQLRAIGYAVGKGDGEEKP